MVIATGTTYLGSAHRETIANCLTTALKQYLTGRAGHGLLEAAEEAGLRAAWHIDDRQELAHWPEAPRNPARQTRPFTRAAFSESRSTLIRPLPGHGHHPAAPFSASTR